METVLPNWDNNIECRHISKAANDIVSYINKRRTGAEKSLRTKWRKFNDVCMGGIELTSSTALQAVAEVAKVYS
jgi:hypothetical protein